MRKLILLLSIGLVAAVAYGATTFTTNYQFNKPGDGDKNYGSLLRDNWDKADAQIYANQSGVSDHISETSGAHAATAISVNPGPFQCTLAANVQEYLDCLDGVLDPGVSGVVLLAGTQTITGAKTFTVSPNFPAAASGILTTDLSGQVSSSSFTDISPLTTKGDILAYDTGATRLAVGSDGQVLVADSSSSEGISWDFPNPRWRKYTYTFSDFSSASTSFSVTALALQSNQGIDAVVVHHTTQFSGGSITAYAVEVGITGNTDLYSKPQDVFQASSGTTRRVSNVLDIPNLAATTDLVVTAKSGGDNLDQATQGSVDVYVRTFELP